MQFPNMQQQGAGQLAGASGMSFPTTGQGASAAAAGGDSGAAAAAAAVAAAKAAVPLPAAPPVLPLPLPAPPAQQGNTEVVNQSEGAGLGGIDDDPCALKKARLIWTPALHRRFLEAVERVGGVEKALPKAVMKVSTGTHSAQHSTAQRRSDSCCCLVRLLHLSWAGLLMVACLQHARRATTTRGP